jgi:diguanylate cyclase (GGDEF)-like protein
MDRVVIVDDARVNGLVLQSYVQELPNLETVTFTRPLEALEWCGANPPDLVLLDYHMPDMDGVAFLRNFRCADTLKDVPVVMVTGEQSREALYLALTSGATDFLRKPVDRVELIARIRNMLDLRGRQRALAAANVRLLELATTDQLTGLKNRRAFIEAVENELHRSQRYGRPFSLAVLDVDHFKHVNDTYGHDAGDAVLRSLAHTCAQSLRNIDPIGRLGGEEFGVLFPETALEDATSACERLLSHVRAAGIAAGEVQLAATVSAGVTDGGRPGDTVNAVIKRADLALYAAKRNGRDRIEVSRGDRPADAGADAAPSRNSKRRRA